MEASCREFVDSLIEHSVGLQDTYRATIEYWHPEEPPVTVLFGELGGRFVDDFDQMHPDAQRHAFGLIETAMATGDDKLVTAVATGLIEAIVGTVVRHEGMWERISVMMGPISRRHADGWMNE